MKQVTSLATMAGVLTGVLIGMLRFRSDDNQGRGYYSRRIALYQSSAYIYKRRRSESCANAPSLDLECACDMDRVSAGAGICGYRSIGCLDRGARHRPD